MKVIVLYDITQPFETNVVYGPFPTDPLPVAPAKLTATYKLFNQPLNSLFGVAACPLTHGSRAVRVMSHLGYDLITYRSVRSFEWRGNAYPHWRYANKPSQLTIADLASTTEVGENPFPGQEVSMVNSFGIQSSQPEYWIEDVNRAVTLLPLGQLLMLSIMCSPEHEGRSVIEDATVIAEFAKRTTAKVFEINLAHPNSGKSSLIYQDIPTSVSVLKAVKKIITDRPIIVKIGYYEQPDMLKDFLTQTKGMLDGISSTNTYAVPIADQEGKQVFPGRAKAGLSGASVRSLSQSQAKSLVTLREELQLQNFPIIGIGGVTKVADIQSYLALGVDAVQAAVGVFANPSLAMEYKSLM